MPVLAEDGYRTNHEFADGLAERSLVSAESDRLSDALVSFETGKELLGLDHFEGRTWAGWHHHVALVAAAWHFRAGE